MRWWRSTPTALDWVVSTLWQPAKRATPQTTPSIALRIPLLLDQRPSRLSAYAKYAPTRATPAARENASPGPPSSHAQPASREPAAPPAPYDRQEKSACP